MKKINYEKIMKKVIQFIKYHNAFAIAMSLILVLTLTAAASEDFRDTVIGEEIVTEQGIDNSLILEIDLDNFDLQMKITGAYEDAQNYYVNYQFQTLGIENNVWQILTRERQLVVPKNALSGQDLGLYVQEELLEIAENELAYLREVQLAERAKGKTEIVETREYTGLIGLVLDIKNKILPGYEPVVEPPQIVAYESEGVGEESTGTESLGVGSLEAPETQEESCQPQTYYIDSDDDGFGHISNSVSSCEPVPGFVLNSLDCDDLDASINPAALEVCDGIDNNCNSLIDEYDVCTSNIFTPETPSTETTTPSTDGTQTTTESTDGIQ